MLFHRTFGRRGSFKGPRGVSLSDTASGPVGHTHWRIYFPVAQNIGIDEMKLREVPGGPDVSGERIGFVSSMTWNNSTPEFGPGKAFDGNTASFWNTTQGNASPSYLGVVFATPKAITEITVRYGANDRAFTSCKIQWSDDGVTWTDYSALHTFAGKKPGFEYRVSKDNMGIMFRLYTTNKDGAVNAAIREIDFGGVPVGPADGTVAWGGVPVQAVDGNTTTRWISGSEANPVLTWIGQSPFIEDYSAVNIRAFYAAGNGDRMPKGFDLSYSKDGGQTWTMFKSITGPSWVTDHEVRTFTLA